MRFTPNFNIPLTSLAMSPARLVRGSVFNTAMNTIDESLQTGDFLELWVANLTGPQDVTVTDATLATRA